MIKFELEEQDINVILKGLGALSINEAFNTVHNMLGQIEQSKQSPYDYTACKSVAGEKTDNASAELAENEYINQ